MRVVLKLLVFLILGPFALLLLFLLAIAAVVGIPLLWEQLVTKLTAPPGADNPQS